LFYKLKLSRRLNSIKLSRSSSRVWWLKDDVSKANTLFSSSEISSFMTKTAIFLETLLYSPFNHLTRLLAPQSVNEHCFFRLKAIGNVLK